MKTEAIVASAGSGKRLKGRIRKPYLALCGKPIIIRTLEALSASKKIDGIVVVVNRRDQKRCAGLIKKYRVRKVKKIIPGGAERSDSVLRGLGSLDGDTDLVVIHDGVRPFISGALIDRSIDAAKRFGAAVVGVPVVSTIKEVDGNCRIVSTPQRNRFWFSQTPQVFRKELILRGYRKSARDGFYSTDDSAYVERLGIKVRLIEGSYGNIKITTKEDLEIAKELVRCG
ncbi:MAG: 2-C-methyl-D-erythritol 4-phosphate cytidylyltransferase [Candidatus Omnitrophota bacterium]